VNRAGPGWLAEFQAHFGDVVRTPLDRSSGTLRATPDRYDAVMTRDARDGPRAPGAARLAVYNRQYWFRLFEVLQAAFPLTARLLGYWTFNGHAGRFLLQVPPRGWDIEAAGLGFVPFLEEELRPEDESTRVALLEAARIDAAWRDVSRAPLRPRYRPSDADATHLLESRLIPSEDLQLVEEHSALLELRRTLNGAGSRNRAGGRSSRQRVACGNCRSKSARRSSSSSSDPSRSGKRWLGSRRRVGRKSARACRRMRADGSRAACSTATGRGSFAASELSRRRRTCSPRRSWSRGRCAS